jgi:uncharacterized RDD family membrane protein YckC
MHTGIGRGAAYEVAPLWLRGVAGVLDLAVEAAGAVALTWLWLDRTSPDLPPRYWNVFDWLVDLATERPEVLLVPAAVFAALFVAWETAWGRLLGAPPIARVAGLRICTGRGRRPGVIRLFLRSAFALALAVPGLLGPAWALASPKRRMLHDILTGSLVLRGDVPDAWDGDDDPGAVRGAAPHLFLDGPRR